MKRTQIPLWSDTFLSLFVGFILSFCLFRYLALPLWAALTAAIVCAVTAAVLAHLILRSRLESKYLLAKDEETKNKLLMHLALDSAENNRRLFAKALRAKGEVERKNGALLVGEELYFLCFGLDPVPADEILKILKRPFDGKKCVLCSRLSPDAQELSRRFSLCVLDGRAVYLLLKDASLLPKRFLSPPGSVKPRFSVRFFRRDQAKPWLLCGVGLLVFSLFTPLKLWYLLAGSAMVVLSLTLRLFGTTA